ncbi:low molecular weight phosphotyrosine protein phosphatase-like isoform X1, partial [Leptotrombidium deliense]
TDEKRGVLFVDLGNICRGPMAQSIFTYYIRQKKIEDKWFTDTCGTGDFHIGKEPDPRVVKVLNAKNVPVVPHKARLICDEDYTKFTWILAMDPFTLSQSEELAAKNSTAKILLLTSFIDNTAKIDDPFYEKAEDTFDKIYTTIYKCIEAFFEKQKPAAAAATAAPATK